MRNHENGSAILEPLLSLREVRGILGISQALLYRLFDRSELETIQVGGRRLIEPETLRQFIAARRRTRRGWEKPRSP